MILAYTAQTHKVKSVSLNESDLQEQDTMQDPTCCNLDNIYIKNVIKKYTNKVPSNLGHGI